MSGSNLDFTNNNDVLYKRVKEGLKVEKKKHFCLFCGAELNFEPNKYGGFCSTECEDSWNES